MTFTDALKSAVKGMPVLMTGGQPGYRAGEHKLAWYRPDLSGPNGIELQSDAFEDEGEIPFKYSADGDNISPPLSWSDVPERAESLALVVEDPDAPTPQPFVHWLLYNIPPRQTSLPEHLIPEGFPAADQCYMQGKNSNLKVGWAGMAPPKGDMPHRYFFQFFALDSMLPLKAGAGRTALFNAMARHVIARARIVGTFQR
ncbi:MAG TPA: YbhB/YbcL family Raf kinase inhibitor-like protein [Humisphaera sp.]|jgi:hypothetical protein|nr:YbhB/YbcL family Raf kinase inhibitor-like protein [Humisphaera sp.]